jgi:RNA polymerase sporulation-specific sigma factor
MSTDEQLARAVRAGDQQAAVDLVDRFEGFLRMVLGRFYTHTSSVEDLRQEARIGLFKACRDYDPAAGLSFKNFVKLVVERHVATYVKTESRLKHQPLTYALRTAENDEGDRVDVVDLIEDPQPGQLEQLVLRTDLAAAVRVIAKELSPLEKAVFTCWINGETYVEAARLLGLSFNPCPDGSQTRSKPVDNALQRARRKVRLALEEPRPLAAAA